MYEILLSSATPDTLDVTTPVVSECTDTQRTNSIAFSDLEISMPHASPLCCMQCNLLYSQFNDTEDLSCTLELSSLDSSQNTYVDENKNEDSNHFNALKSIQISFINQLIISQFNINSLHNKLDVLSYIVRGKLDILVVTESKIDESFCDDHLLWKVTLLLCTLIGMQMGMELLFT